MTAEQLRDANPGSDAPTGNRRLLAYVRGGETTTLAQHRLAFARPIHTRRGGHDLIANIEAAGLRGRGGAAFPAATKLRAVAQGRGKPIVVVNGTEGEPASRKDVTLLRLQPHLVLDGAAWAAAAIDASNVFICVDRTKPAALEVVQQALREREANEPRGVTMQLMATPPRYVAGEETALVHWINGGDAKPTKTPPRPFERGVGGRPTLVNNVETLAHLAQIATFGAHWFRSTGTEAEPGTALVTLSGAVQRSAVYEVPLGAALADLLARGEPTAGVGAVLVGGYFGTWLSADAAARARLSNASLGTVGAALGCGAVAVLPEAHCGVRESARVLSWLARETAGQCGPCVHGLRAIADMFNDVAKGRASRTSVEQLHRWADQVDGRGACRFPDGAVRFLRSALDVFHADIARHAAGRPCDASHQANLLPIPRTSGDWR